MTSSIRPLLSFALASALALCGGAVQAQAWPAKPIKIVAPVPPGGGVDFLSRAIAQKLAGRLRRAGAGREQGRRERAGRHRLRRQVAARRQHAADGLLGARHQQVPRQTTSTYDLERDLVPVIVRRLHPADPGDAARLSAEQRRRADRAAEGEPGQVLLRLGRRGRRRAPRRGDVQGDGRHDDAARARTRATRRRSPTCSAATCRSCSTPSRRRCRWCKRQAEGARDDRAEALAARARAADDDRGRRARLRDQRLVHAVRAEEDADRSDRTSSTSRSTRRSPIPRSSSGWRAGRVFVGGTPEQAETFLQSEITRWGDVIKARPASRPSDAACALRPAFALGHRARLRAAHATEALAQQKATWNSEPSYDTEDEMAAYFRANGVRDDPRLRLHQEPAAGRGACRYHDYAIEVQARIRRDLRQLAADRSAHRRSAARTSCSRCIEASAGFVGYCVSAPGMGFVASDPIYDAVLRVRARAATGRCWCSSATPARAPACPGGGGVLLDLSHPRYVDQLAVAYPDLQIVAGRARVAVAGRDDRRDAAQAERVARAARLVAEVPHRSAQARDPRRA